MICGNGLLGQAFRSAPCSLPPDAVVVAQGVSNSLETNEAAFQREWQTLRGICTDPGLSLKRVVYFSTSRLDQPLTSDDRQYFHHKRDVERWLLDALGSRVLIVRLPHVVGMGGHPNTAFNYLWRSVCQAEPFVVFAGGEQRELMDVADIPMQVHQWLAAGRHGVHRMRGCSLEVTKIVSDMRLHLAQLRSPETDEAGIEPDAWAKMLIRYATLNREERIPIQKRG